jgi:hypothetical protein
MIEQLSINGFTILTQKQYINVNMDIDVLKYKISEQFSEALRLIIYHGKDHNKVIIILLPKYYL